MEFLTDAYAYLSDNLPGFIAAVVAVLTGLFADFKGLSKRNKILVGAAMIFGLGVLMALFQAVFG